MAGFLINTQPNTQDIVFQNTAITTGNGQALTVGGLKTLTVEIFGTATSGTINFQGMQASGTVTTIIGTLISNISMTQATSTSSISTTPSIWQFDITGLKTVQMNISAVSGGNITVQGTAVAA